MKYWFFVVTIVLITVSNCSRSDCYREYSFDFPVNIYPVNDTINIGDTLWIEINIANTIEDKETGEIVDISDLDLHFVMFNSRYDNLYINNSIEDFDIYLTKGVFQVSPTRSFVAFENTNDKNFKMAIVPKTTGGQMLSITLPADVLNGRLNLNDECTGYYSDSTTITINNSGERNIYHLDGLYLIVPNLGDTLYYGTGSELEKYIDTYVFYVQ